MGLDPFKFLRADRDEALIYGIIMSQADEYILKLQKRQAILIANHVGQLFKK